MPIVAKRAQRGALVLGPLLVGQPVRRDALVAVAARVAAAVDTWPKEHLIAAKAVELDLERHGTLGEQAAPERLR